jgi:hypothetical protein
MAKPGRKPKTMDINQLAAAITEAVTGEPVGSPAKEEPAKNPAAVALWVYPRRAAGGHRHHRSLGRLAGAGHPEDPRRPCPRLDTGACSVCPMAGGVTEFEETKAEFFDAVHQVFVAGHQDVPPDPGLAVNGGGDLAGGEFQEPR